MIKYYLKKNLLSKDEANYIAQVAASGTIDYDKLIDKILGKGTTLTRPDLYAALEALNDVIEEYIAEGYNINMPLYSIGYSISGTFTGANDQFDPERHQLNINFSRSNATRKLSESVKHEKVAAPAASNVISEYYDTAGSAADLLINPGGGFMIMGENVKLLGDDPSVGLYFVADDGTETKCDAIIENKPKKITGVNPSLAAGVYHLKLVTQYNGSSQPSKTVRTVDYEVDLTVY